MYGMPSLVELHSVEESIALCKELGLSFLELNSNFPNQQLRLLDPDALKKLAEEAGIFYTLHLNDEMYVADFNDLVSNAYCEAVSEAIGFAKKTGIEILNMHLSNGACYTMPEKKIYFYEAYETQYLEKIRIFRDLCEEWVGDSPIRICIENTNGYLPFQQRALMCLIESPVFGFTLDIGHNYCANGADEQLILSKPHRLHHLHLHDAQGKQDHLPFGHGQIALDPYIALAADRTAVIEVKTVEGLRKSLEWLNA